MRDPIRPSFEPYLFVQRSIAWPTCERAGIAAHGLLLGTVLASPSFGYHCLLSPRLEEETPWRYPLTSLCLFLTSTCQKA